MRQRVLVILPRIPFPARDGAEVVMSHTLRQLATRYELDVFALNPSRQRRNPEILAGEARIVGSAEINTDIEIPSLLWRLMSPLAATLRGRAIPASYWISRFFDFDALAKLQRFVADNGPYDVIHCETLFTAFYGLQLDSERVVLRSHNVEWMIQDNLATESSWINPTSIVRRILAAQTKKYETLVAGLFDRIACISDADCHWYRSVAPHASVRHVHIGVSIPTDTKHFDAPNSIGFLGSVDWEPNRRGLDWFLHDVFPIILAQKSDAFFTIAGRGSLALRVPERIQHATRILGEVDSAASFLESQCVVISPLFSGSGVRIKLLEAFAQRRPVVTTSKGAEGLPVNNGLECMIADDPAEFAASCIELLNQREKAAAMGNTAQEFVQQHYSWEASMVELERLYFSPA